MSLFPCMGNRLLADQTLWQPWSNSAYHREHHFCLAKALLNNHTAPVFSYAMYSVQVE